MVDIKLLNFIKDGLNKGYNHDELRDILKKNNWEDSEIQEALESIKKPTESHAKPIPIQSKPKRDVLTKFIKVSLAKGAREHEIRLALLSKGWPVEKINRSFDKLNKYKSTNPVLKKQEYVGYGAPQEGAEKESPSTKESPKEKPKEPSKINSKSILLYLLSFFIAVGVILGTTMVFYFMWGVNNFDGTCPDVGICQEMKDSAIEYAYGNLLVSLIISVVISFAVLLTHTLVPNKEILLWIVNLIYLSFVLFIAYLWIKFVTA